MIRRSLPPLGLILALAMPAAAQDRPDITLAVDNLWEKAKKRQAKQQRRAQGGKLLLQQLQDEAGAKDPSLLPGVMRAPAGDPRYAPPTMAAAVKNAIWGQPPPADPTTGLVPVGDAVAVKQGYMYKLKAAKRRAKQAMLVSTSKTRKVPDEDFDALWARVQRQEALLNKIKADGKRYAKAMKELSAAAQSISGHIVELAEGGEKEAELGGSSEQPPPAERPAGTGASREQVVARARQLAEVMGTIDADVRPACEGQLWSSVTQPVIEPRGAAMTPRCSRRTTRLSRHDTAAQTSSTRSLTCGGPANRPVVFSRYQSSRCVHLPPAASVACTAASTAHSCARWRRDAMPLAPLMVVVPGSWLSSPASSRSEWRGAPFR